MKKVKKVNIIMAGGATCDYTKEFKDYYTDDIEKTSEDIVKQIMNEEVIFIKRGDNRMTAVHTRNIIGITVDFKDVEEDEET